MNNSCKTKGGVFWFTGLSGAGKTTISQNVAVILRENNISCLLLDGDVCRKGLCSDLGYSEAERMENVRRIREVAALCVDQGLVCLCAFITPFEAMRKELRLRLGGDYHEIFVDCPLDECMKRDVKKLYAKVRNGHIPQFTGIDSPYEIPDNPDLHLNTRNECLDDCVRRVIALISDRLALNIEMPTRP